MRYCGYFLIKAEGGAKNYKRDHPLPSFSCSKMVKDGKLLLIPIPGQLNTWLIMDRASTALEILILFKIKSVGRIQEPFFRLETKVSLEPPTE